MSCLLDQYSVNLALICEHKLSSHSREFLGLIHKDNNISVESCSINPYNLAACGKRGLAILAKKTLPCYVSHIDTVGSDRIIGVELKYHNMSPIYFIGAYLPAANNRTVFMDSLSELDAITSFYSSKGNIIIAGEFNAPLPRDAIGTCVNSNPKRLVILLCDLIL